MDEFIRGQQAARADICEDNTATIQVCRTGKNDAMRRFPNTGSPNELDF